MVAERTLREIAKGTASLLITKYGHAEIAKEIAKKIDREGISLSKFCVDERLNTMVIEELEIRAPYALWGRT